MPVLGADDRAGVPTDPPVLAQHAARTAALLRRLERDPLPRIRCGGLEAATAAAELEAGRWRLEALLEDIDAAEAAVGSTRQDAASAAERAAAVASAVACAMEGLVGLGEDAGLAPGQET